MADKITAAIIDVESYVKKVNAELTKAKSLSADFANNMSKASGRSGGGPAGSMSYGSPATATDIYKQISGGGGTEGGPSGPPGPPGPPGPGEGGSSSSSSMSFGQKAAGIGFAASEMVNPSDYITNDLARRRFGFYSGKFGTTAGSNAFQSMMNSGTATSPLDAANAAMSGISNGLMPGLPNYGTVGKSAATISNVMPGVGLEGGMEAVGALNQAKSVNMLRMIGIKVRDGKGLPRDVSQIANDFWNLLQKTKRSSGAITQQDLAISLQSGNYLDLLMNQYFGGDPILRESITAILFQKASGAGGSKAALRATGANPAISQSIGGRNAAAYDLTNQLTTGAVKGSELGNNTVGLLSSISSNIDKLTSFVTGGNGGVLSIGAGLTTGIQTIMGGAGGGIGSILGGLLGLFHAGDGVGSPSAAVAGGMGDGKRDPSANTGVTMPFDGYSTKSITSNWGQRRYLKLNGNMTHTPPHSGTDYGIPEGTSVKSIKPGKVSEVGNNPDKTSGYGKYVVVQHADGFSSLYAHLSDNSLVNVGDSVGGGTVIGKSGKTGAATGAHLHLTVEKDGVTYNPLQYLAGSESPTDESPNGVIKVGNLNSTNSGASVILSSDSSSSSSGSSTSGNSHDPHALFREHASGNLFADPYAGKGGGVTSPGAIRATASGGVTVHINVQGGNFNEQTLAREVKRVLDANTRMNVAVAR